MNKIYKVVWSKVKNCYVVVSELAKNVITGGVKSAKVGKSPMAKGLALGAVMAFVITGNALAANNDFVLDGTETERVGVAGNYTLGSNEVTLDATKDGWKQETSVDGGDIRPSIILGVAGTTYNTNQEYVEVSLGENQRLNLIPKGTDKVTGAIAWTKIVGGEGSVVSISGYNPALGYFSKDSIKAEKIILNSTHSFAVYASNQTDMHELEADVVDITAYGRAVFAQNGINKITTNELNITSTEKKNAFTVNGTGGTYVYADKAVVNGGIELLNSGAELSFKSKNGESLISTIQLKGSINATQGNLTGMQLSGTDSFIEGAINTKGNENATVSFSNGATFNAKDKSELETFGGSGGVIALDQSLLNTANAVMIANNTSTGTVVKVRDLDLTGGAKEALTGLEDKLKSAVTYTNGTDGKDLAYEASAIDVALRGDVELKEGKVITTMDTDDLVVAGDVKAATVNGIDLVGEFNEVNTTLDTVANHVQRNEENIATLQNGLAKKIDNTATGAAAVGLGYEAQATGVGSVAIGYGMSALGQPLVASGDNAIAIGTGTNAENYSATAVGAAASATGWGSLALGYVASAEGKNSVAIGTGSIAKEDNVVSFGSGKDEDPNQYRKLVNVADGVADTDAVNKGQLDAAIGSKANASDVYTKTEVDTHVKNVTDHVNDVANNTNEHINTVSESLTEQINDVSKNITEHVNAVQEDLSGAIVENIKDIAALETKTEGIQTDLSKLNTEVENTNKVLNEVASGLDKVNTEIQNTNAHFNTELGKTNELVVENANDIAALETKTGNIQTDLSDLNKEVENTNATVNKVAEGLDAVNTEIQNTNAHFNTELGKTNEQVVANAKDIAALENKTDTIQTDLSNLNNEVVKTNEELQKTNANVSALNDELVKTNEHFNAELDKTNQQVVANAENIAALESATGNIQADLSSLNNEVVKTNEELQKTNANVSALNDELVKTNEHFNAELGKTNEQVVANAKDIATLENKTDTIQTDLSSLNNEVVKTNEELQKTNANVSALNDELVKTNEHFNAELGKTNQQVVANAENIAANKKAIATEEEARIAGDEANAKAIEANSTAISNNAEAISGLNQRLGKMNGKINKVGAGAAALAALHPLDYDPDDKLTFSAGVGNYAGENAMALGAFYRPDEKLMFSLGGTMGNGENMVNLGVSIGLDGAKGTPKLSKKELVQKVSTMEAENQAIKAENEALEERVAKLEALVAKLAEK